MFEGGGVFVIIIIKTKNKTKSLSFSVITWKNAMLL